MTHLMIQEALSGKRGKDQQRIAQESTRSLEILLKKNHDYGGSAWKKPILCPDLDVGTAILVRMSDKIERLQKLLPKDTTPQIEESVEDTMRDLGNYCQLWLARPKEKEPCLRRNTIPTEETIEDCENTYYRTPDGEVVAIPLHHNVQIPSDWLLATEGSKEEKEIADRAVTIREEFTNIEEPGFSVKVDPDKDYGVGEGSVNNPSDRHENQ